MINRKEVKLHARGHMKRHYMLLVFVCALSIFMGTEFTYVKENAQRWYDILTGAATVLDIGGLSSSPNSMEKIVDDLIADNIEAGREEAAQRIRELETQSDPTSALGRTRGFLAGFVNSVSSGHLYAELGAALHNAFHSQQLAAVLMIIGAALIQLFIWIFLKNLYDAILCRAFLETRTYSAFPLSHTFHIWQVRRWLRSAITLFLAEFFELLWWLTIVGGVIKHFSYFAVPFIVAENPDIKPLEAIRLSRQMMNGHKWECFKLQLSYLGWMILGFITFGVVDVLWTVPYTMAGYTEYYAQLREGAIDAGIPGAERLNDVYLYTAAGRDLLLEHYPEIAMNEEIIKEDIVQMESTQRFLTRNFGIWTGRMREKMIYSRQEGLRQQTRVDRMELNSEAYPDRLNPLWRKGQNSLSGKVSYLAPCTVWSLIIIFFTFCVVGWIWEVSLHLMTDGTFVNRGAMHGPWLPIYGSGVALVAILLYRLRKNPILEAVAIMVLCGIVEYSTSYFMELSSGLRWWDYTGYFLNLNGRICAEGLVVFAVGGMAAVYLLVPLIDAIVTKIKLKILIPVCVALLILFGCDMVYSHFVPNVGEGITDYAKPETQAAPQAETEMETEVETAMETALSEAAA